VKADVISKAEARRVLQAEIARQHSLTTRGLSLLELIELVLAHGLVACPPSVGNGVPESVSDAA
jgi:hypothetical protein